MLQEAAAGAVINTRGLLGINTSERWKKEEMGLGRATLQTMMQLQPGVSCWAAGIPTSGRNVPVRVSAVPSHCLGQPWRNAVSSWSQYGVWSCFELEDCSPWHTCSHLASPVLLSQDHHSPPLAPWVSSYDTRSCMARRPLGSWYPLLTLEMVTRLIPAWMQSSQSAGGSCHWYITSQSPSSTPSPWETRSPVEPWLAEKRSESLPVKLFRRTVW